MADSADRSDGAGGGGAGGNLAPHRRVRFSCEQHGTFRSEHVPDPNIILITLDTLRADRVGAMRNGHHLTPNLSALGDAGSVFTRAVAAGVPTFFGFPPMFRGGGALDAGKSIGIGPDDVSFVEVLAQRGYRTAAVVASNPYLSRYYGYDAGFQVFDDSYATRLGERQKRQVRSPVRVVRRIAGDGITDRLKRAKAKLNYARECMKGANPALHEGSRAEALTARALSLIAETEGEEPFFLWLHYMDIHGYFYATQADRLKALGRRGPWADAVVRWKRFRYVDRWTRQIVRTQEVGPDAEVPHTEQDERYISGFYDASVMYTDRCLGPLLDWVTSSGRTVALITADHGEQFYDHGGLGHAPLSLYEELARVPLLLYGPGVAVGEDSRWVSHSAIPATLLELAGAPPTAGPTSGMAQARSLLADDSSEAPVLTEALYGVGAPFPGHRFPDADLLLSCRKGRHKLVWCEATGSEKLFDLEADPAEKENLAGRPGLEAIESSLRAVIRDRSRGVAVLDERAKLSERVRRLGRSLGLAGSKP